MKNDEETHIIENEGEHEVTELSEEPGKEDTTEPLPEKSRAKKTTSSRKNTPLSSSKKTNSTKSGSSKPPSKARSRSRTKSNTKSPTPTSDSVSESIEQPKAVPKTKSKTKLKGKPKALPKAKKTAKAKPQPKKSTALASPPPSPDSEETEQPALRRSTRHRIPPVKSWMNERIVYEQKIINGAVVRELVDVIHRDDLKQQEIKHQERLKKRRASMIPRQNDVKRQRKDTHKKKNKSKSKPARRPSSSPDVIDVTELDAIEEDEETSPEVEVAREKSVAKEKEKQPDIMSTLETGKWASKPELEGKLRIPVFDGPGSENLTERTVAYASKANVRSKEINSPQENFRVLTYFDQDSEFSGGGIIEIPVGSRKDIKSNDDTYFIFHVIQGTLEVTLSQTTFAVTKGFSFEIPMGNYYTLVNKGKDEVRLFFVQSKYILVASDPYDDEFNSDDDE
ncbi:unnamed protein product [Ambrosiozyma monospora]|uniref:Unnamed protein product n=1 Tax=Ambrosiozyma monospora TaxID=43982 RepID=A0A9W6Z243_AMBMO|nr:unnamed protein product [Ambrosiozyma monospora]